MNEFLEKLKYNYSQRQTFRFFMFTYPKTTALIGLATAVGLTIAAIDEFNEIDSFNQSFKNTIHSNDNTPRRNNKILIYNSDSK